MIRINEIKLSLEEEEKLLKHKIAKKLKIKIDKIKDYHIYRRSIDARKKDNIYFVYTVDVNVENEDDVLNKIKSAVKSPKYKYVHPIKGEAKLNNPPIIIGSGPAGMFCALILAQNGYNPILLERGEDVDNRTKSIDRLWNDKELNIESNVQFGEGGAGTFSDGKLTTRIKDKRCRKVLEEFVNAGAPNEILYLQKPHIGTDILKNVVKNMRESIIAHGGEVRFNSKVTNILIKDNKVSGVCINDNEKLESDVVILGIGHSARDTYEMLHKNHILIEQKPFSVGVRIEHPQEFINESQYRSFKDHPKLGAADYALTYKNKGDRGVYTFCMCPGGTVVAAASESGMVVTNGMSEFKRDKENANSALLVQIREEDFDSQHPLAGMEFQRNLEKKAFASGGSNYNAPAQLVKDFLEGKPSTKEGSVKPSYKPGVKWTDLNECLPTFICDSLKVALIEIDKKLRGFKMDDAVMTAVETRSSAPIRILRDPKTLESTNTKGLYPIGEGSGYAGGIVSAAVDGIKGAESIISKYII